MKNIITLLICTLTYFSGASQSIELVKSFAGQSPIPGYHNMYTEHNGKLYFAAGNSIWVTDGTESGTTFVKGFGNKIYGLTSLGSQLIFAANDGNTGYELWTSDGTEIGTKLLLDINPLYGHGVYLPPNSDYESFTKMGGYIYFYGNDSTNGIELWKSDGTVQGTSLVKDINQTPGDGLATTSTLRNIVAINNRVVFVAKDTISGYEMWQSNGTALGTTMITELTPGKNNNHSVVTLLKYNDNVIFNFNADIYITDGTETNTIKLMDNIKDASTDIVTFNNKAYFYTEVDPFANAYNAIIETDGTPQGTKELFKISSGGNAINKQKNYLSTLNSSLFFVGEGLDGGTTHDGLWISDGSGAGTHILQDFDSDPYLMSVFGKKLYFKVSDAPNQNVHVWESDGTTLGTKKTMHPFANYATNGSLAIESFLRHSNLMPYGNYAYFFYSYDNINRGLYRIGMWPDNIAETNKDNDISIYPNPAQTQAIITGTDIQEITIKNIAGITVHQQTIDNNLATIDMKSWTPGIYIATITTRNHETTYRKLIKQ